MITHISAGHESASIPGSAYWGTGTTVQAVEDRMGKGRQHEQKTPTSLGSDWVDEEISGTEMPGARLKARLCRFIKDMSRDISSSIPTASGNWADIKAGYRMLANPRVGDQEIISGHLQATRCRVQATQGPILVLHDTASFTFELLYPEDLGFLGRLMPGYCEEEEETERPENRICGLLTHASLAVSQDAVPLGLCALRFWSRKEFGKARKDPDDRESRRWIEGLEQSMTLLDEPARCVHVADRESDIYELFCTAETQGTYFLVRASADRLVGDGGQSIEDVMLETRLKGLHRVLPPRKGKNKGLPAFQLTVLYAQERRPPLNRKPLSWKLITNLPIESRGPRKTPLSACQSQIRLDWSA